MTTALPSLTSDHQPRAKRVRGTGAVERAAAPVLLAPAVAVVLALRVLPLAIAAWLSFTDANLSTGASPRSVGLSNYTSVLTSTDFHEAVATTLWIVVPALVLEMSFGLLIALWLNRPMRGRSVLRGATLLPYLLVPVVIGNFFRMLYSAQFGQLNYLLMLFGLGPHAWLTDPSTVRWSVVVMEAWHTTPFVALLCLAGLSGLPREPIEAAMVDGAGALQRFRYVTLPALRPILLTVLALRAMDAIQLFDEVYVMTGGGPGRLTSVINLYLYQNGFREFEVGKTSAAVVIVVLAIVIVALAAAVARRLTARGAR